MMKKVSERRSLTGSVNIKNRNPAFCALIGFMISCVTYIVSLCALSAVALGNDDPNALCAIFGIVSIAVALFSGGLAAAAASANDKAASAALCGVIFTLAAAAVRMIVGVNTDSRNMILVFFAFPLVSLSAAFAAELIGKSMKKNKKKKTKFERK